MPVTYLPVYSTDGLFSSNKHSDSVDAVVCFRSRPTSLFNPLRYAQIRFHAAYGTVVCRYVDMSKDDYWSKLATFVAQEIWRDTRPIPINGAIVWKPLSRAEAETLNAVGVPLYYATDSF